MEVKDDVPQVRTPLSDIHAKIVKFFEGDEDKAQRWFETSNPLLGGVCPYDMILAGRTQKLFKWIDQQLAENAPTLEGDDSTR